MVEKPKRRSRSSSSSSSGSSSSGSSSSSDSSSSSSASRSPTPKKTKASSREERTHRRSPRRSRSRSPRRAQAKTEKTTVSSSRRSPSPTRRRQPSPVRHRSPRRSPPPRRERANSPPPRERREPTPEPPARRLCVRNLSRNVTKAHLEEIFTLFGVLKSCELPMDRLHSHLPRGYGYVEYDKSEDAEKAMKHMDGAQIDGLEIQCEITLPYRGGRGISPMAMKRERSRSPRRMGGGRHYGSPPAHRRLIAVEVVHRNCAAPVQIQFHWATATEDAIGDRHHVVKELVEAQNRGKTAPTWTE